MNGTPNPAAEGANYVDATPAPSLAGMPQAVILAHQGAYQVLGQVPVAKAEVCARLANDAVEGAIMTYTVAVALPTPRGMALSKAEGLLAATLVTPHGPMFPQLALLELGRSVAGQALRWAAEEAERPAIVGADGRRAN